MIELAGDEMRNLLVQPDEICRAYFCQQNLISFLEFLDMVVEN